ncbi:MAG: hypothetical protein Q7S20_00105 [Gemmatimonadaceae bacterium]|nr:hypothetical protein [Gemmatimonadaceae bacterium]
MDDLLDELSRRLATATSRRDAVRVMLAAIFGGAGALACAVPTEPKSCLSDSCKGSDGKCYGPCASGSYCTTSPSGNCSSPSAGGVYCCAGSGGTGSGYKLWKGSFRESFYDLNIWGERARIVTGKPFMVVKYNKITSDILDCEFGLSEVTQQAIPGFDPAPPYPTLSATTIDYHSELNLQGSVALCVGWSSKSSITLPNGSPIKINSSAIFSFKNGSSPGGVGYNAQWSFSQTNITMVGGVKNIDTTYYLGIDSDPTSAFHLKV